MASQPGQQPSSPPKRPRLSLQIKTSGGRPISRCTRGFPVNPSDPTAFNTLSNAYTTAVERSNPMLSEPLTAIKTSLQSFSIVSPIEPRDLKQRVVTPYVASYPETPVSAGSSSPVRVEMNYPSTMTATPPLSGQPPSATETRGKVFTFSAADTAASPMVQNMRSPIEPPKSPWRRAAPPPILHRAATHPPPYTHPRSLHSILRNSPLPPRTAIPPASPRRQSVRIQERAARRVDYDSPIEREIINTIYTRSHIDLLAEDASPMSASPITIEPRESIDSMTDVTTTPTEAHDGGRSPGGLEDMRRKMGNIGKTTPSSPSAGPTGIRKRGRKEKRRRWVWTIGEDNEEEDEGEEKRPVQPATAMSVPLLKVPSPQARKVTVPDDEAKTPVESGPRSAYQFTRLRPQPSIESVGSSSVSSADVEMSDATSTISEESYATSSEPDQDQEQDIKTPTQSTQISLLPALPVGGAAKRDTPIPELEVKHRDSPVPLGT